jgi:hypothetical protein
MQGKKGGEGEKERLFSTCERETITGDKTIAVVLARYSSTLSSSSSSFG